MTGDRILTSITHDWMDEQGTAIVAFELSTGRRLWSTILPPSDSGFGWWSRVIAVGDGRAYASRSSAGLADEYLYALDLNDGSILWRSEDLVDMGLGGSPTFLPDGDLVVNGEFLGSTLGYNHLRIDAGTGATVWDHARHMDPEDGGGAALGDRLYARFLVGGAFVVRRLDPATGLPMYGIPPFQPRCRARARR